MKKRNAMLQKIFTLILIPALIVLGSSAYMKSELPIPDEILSPLTQEPVQKNVDGEEFSFEYRGTEYFAKPIAEYSIAALVVSHNNIHSIMDMYHHKDSVDTKDLCVVWGENVENGSYLDTKIENHSWTCYFQYDYGVPFRPFQLSNNHLITDDDSIREKIKYIHVGDQVRIIGKLVDYGEDSENYYRITSDTRNDTNETARGGGACEVVFVEDIKVLKAANPQWHLVFDFSKTIVIALFMAKLFFFVLGAYRQKRFSEKILQKREKENKKRIC
jgi:hypothetical protein